MKMSSFFVGALACSTAFFAFEYFRTSTAEEDRETRMVVDQRTSPAPVTSQGLEARQPHPMSASEDDMGAADLIAKKQGASVWERLCSNSDDGSSCTVNPDLNVAKVVFDSELRAARSSEAAIILGSSNFSEIINGISGTDSASIMKSVNFTQRASELFGHIDPTMESDFSCNNDLCLAKIHARSEENWAAFQQEFFTGEAAGNLLVYPDPQEPHAYRVLLALGDGLPVIIGSNAPVSGSPTQ
uniref:hypothetical protein n=1 Tax=Microbulbifer agarilyticus TaxID=260552 RepID=UPI000255B47F|nr:hypothetical protein [Microbulbifer agarilyticus]